MYLDPETGSFFIVFIFFVLIVVAMGVAAFFLWGNDNPEKKQKSNQINKASPQHSSPTTTLPSQQSEVFIYNNFLQTVHQCQNHPPLTYGLCEQPRAGNRLHLSTCS